MADGCTSRDLGEQGRKATRARSCLQLAEAAGPPGHAGAAVCLHLPHTAEVNEGLLPRADGSCKGRHCIANREPNTSHQGLGAVQHIVPGALVLSNAVGRADTIQTDQGRARRPLQGAAGGEHRSPQTDSGLAGCTLLKEEPTGCTGRAETDEHCCSAPVGKAVLRVTVGEGCAAGVHKLILPCSAAPSTPAGSRAQACL